MKLLNSGYESNQGLDASGNTITVNNSLYYNSKSGTCYNGQSNVTTTCDFTNTGLKNDTTKNLISETIYYLGGYNSTSVYADQVYRHERETLLGKTEDDVNRTTQWIGKISLPYPSDYGYAADLGLCTQMLVSYNDPACANNNWMKSILGTSHGGWLISPRSNKTYSSWNVGSGDVGCNRHSNTAIGVIPTLYLISKVTVDQEVGTGDINSPYQIKIS